MSRICQIEGKKVALVDRILYGYTCNLYNLNEQHGTLGTS